MRSEPPTDRLDDPAARSEEDLYRIGTVAQLTQISVERLRAWERRYGLVPAHRAGKTRFYSASQLSRLAKIKRLSTAFRVRANNRPFDRRRGTFLFFGHLVARDGALA